MITVGCPSITDLEIDRVVKTLKIGRLTQGDQVAAFEKALGAVLHVPHVVACSSGTAALHLALHALGLQAGEEVIVPDLTFVAPVNAVAYTGAKPVIVDIDPDMWTLNLQAVEARITKRTRAILPVHLYGIPCNMNAVMDLADRYGLYVVEDAAEAFGGSWAGKPCGTWGTCGAFSFYANKLITTGEGGAVVTSSDTLVESLRYYRRQAQDYPFYHTDRGFNYRMTEMQAAIGLAQLERLPELIDHRHLIMELYQDRGLLESPYHPEMAPWLYTGLLPHGVSYKQVADFLANAGIETRPVFTPMHRLPMYYRRDSFPVSDIVYEQGISLPTHANLKYSEVMMILSTLEKSFELEHV